MYVIHFYIAMYVCTSLVDQNQPNEWAGMRGSGPHTFLPKQTPRIILSKLNSSLTYYRE